MAGATSSARRTFMVLSAAAAAFSIMQSLVTPVLPTIQHDLHTSPGSVTWVLTAWLLSASVATPLLGRIGDMIGKERTLLVALGAIAVGCLIAALAPNLGVLIVGRVVQGLGGAVFPVSFGIIRDEFPPERVPSAVGGLSAVIAAGGGLGIVLAGPIVGVLDWRWLFWIPMIIVTVTAILAHRYVPESPVRTPGRVDWLAAVFLSGWLVALLIPLSEASSWGWGSARVIALFAAAVVLFALWITVETRSRNPLINMRMLRLPAVWTTNLVALLFGAGMFSVYAFLPQFMQTPREAGYGLGSTITGAGLLMLPMLVTMAVGGSVSGPISHRVSAKAQLVLGSAGSMLSCAAFAAYHDQPWQLAVAGGVFGLGLGLAYASMTSLIVQSVPANQTGAASGMNANIRTIGGSIGTAVVSSIVTGHLQPSGLPYESGFTHSFSVLALTSAAAVVVALFIPSARGRRASAATVRETPAAAPASVGGGKG
ncbi:MFS transporter [Planotetraspora kaengkrachanensis]|uniref:MFS transporter n=1 Tax=Planotetraspora kaengkrachanensis TaxID=575193 RepID=A0A8J3PZB1_9ACTN|nr:MFS transporter [Planotetraspora kaengkrachanensis]GIG83884.1 MFS transporter [Planotetraspora kaengkrachanensis]